MSSFRLRLSQPEQAWLDKAGVPTVTIGAGQYEIHTIKEYVHLPEYAQGCRLAVVTNKEGRYTNIVLQAHNLLPLFDRVISGDSLASKKPDPAGARQCMEAFAAAPERTLNSSGLLGSPKRLPVMASTLARPAATCPASSAGYCLPLL